MLFKQFLELLAKTANHFKSDWRIEKRENGDPQIRLTVGSATHCPATAVSKMIRETSHPESFEVMSKVLNMPLYRIRDIALAADGFDMLGLHKAMRREMLSTLGLKES